MIGLVAALPRELAPLVRGWRHTRQEGVDLFTSERALAACAGMGADYVTHAAEAVAQRGATVLVSVGWAGGVSAAAHGGQLFIPATVIDAATGERFATGIGQGTLASVNLVAGAGAKRDLASRFAADLVDMEAAAVARHAARRGLPFYAVKAISDPHDARLPDLNRFTRRGQFGASRFLAHVALRPWLWPAVARMGRDSHRAVLALAQELEQWIAAGGPPPHVPRTSSGQTV